jgi:hypothetical protein
MAKQFLGKKWRSSRFQIEITVEITVVPKFMAVLASAGASGNYLNFLYVKYCEVRVKGLMTRLFQRPSKWFHALSIRKDRRLKLSQNTSNK